MARSVEDALVVRMETTLRKFEREMERGRKAANTAAIGAEKAWQRAGTQITANANRATSGLGRLTKISGSGRFVLQNTANQIGDIAVQLEGGASKARVMGQQLPQLLGGFGALGGALGVVAPLLGTLAAVGIPAVAMFWNMSEGADEASKKVKTFEDKLSEAEGALSRAEKAMQTASTGGLEDLLEKYGEVTEAVRELAKELMEIEVRAAKVEVGNVVDAALGEDFKKQIESIFGGIGSAIVAPTEEGIELAKAAVQELQTEIAGLEGMNQPVPFYLTEQLKLAKEELAALQGDFANAANLVGQMQLSPDLAIQIADAERGLRAAVEAGDFKGVADGISEVKRLIDETGSEIDEEVRDRLVQAEDKARAMANTLEDAKAAAEGITEVDIAGGISPAVDEAVKLAHNLGISLDLARRIAAFGPQGVGSSKDPSGRTYSGRGGDPRQQGGSFFDWQTREATEWLDNYKAPKTSKGGGGSKSKKPGLFEGTEKQIEALKQQIELIGKTTSEVAELKAKWDLLAEAKERGLDLDARQVATGETLSEQIERQAASVGNLTKQYEEAEAQAAFFDNQQQQLKEGLLDAIVEGENFAGVLEDVAKSLAKAALQAALFGDGPLSGMFGGGGGGGLLGWLFPNAKGNAFDGGRVTAFAKGGVVSQPTVFPMANGAGLMGEAGPEAVMPLARLANGRLGVEARGGGSGGDTFNIYQTMNMSANGDESVKRIVAGELPKFAAATEKKIMEARRRGGAMKSAFSG